MGWSSGSQLAEDIWNEVSKYIPKVKKKKVARKIVNYFESMDCDTMEDCEQLMRDAKISYDEDTLERIYLK